MMEIIMRYNRINSCECVNGEGWGITLFTQGCPHHCLGCFSPETWDYNKGYKLDRKVESIIYQLMDRDYIKRFTLSGGDPLIEENLKQLNHILCTIKSNWPDKKIWIWTGYTWEELQERQKKSPDLLFITFKYTDYLVAGPFIQEEKNLTLPWRGSRNQEVIDIQKTIKEGKKILYV